jgi:hypothetical protein
MGWKTINGKRYYYQYVRQGGRTVEKYVGPGQIGQKAEAEVAARRAAKKAKKEAEQAQWDRLVADLAGLDQLRADADDRVRTALLAAGYHQHARGAWRRKRRVRPAPE